MSLGPNSAWAETDLAGRVLGQGQDWAQPFQPTEGSCSLHLQKDLLHVVASAYHGPPGPSPQLLPHRSRDLQSHLASTGTEGPQSADSSSHLLGESHTSFYTRVGILHLLER